MTNALRTTHGGAKYETQLCAVIIEDLFGKIVGNVAEIILKENCQLPTLLFKLKGKVSMALIRKSLATLVHFGFVKFYLDTNMKSVYMADHEKIIRAITAPRACLIAKTLYGPLAEAICEEIFANGQLTCSNVIRKVMTRDETATVDKLKQSFANLAGAQFVMRLPRMEKEIHGCPQFETGFDPFIMPNAIMEKKNEETTNTRKRKVGDEPEDNDNGEYWVLNWNRFDAYIRDELIVDYLIGNASTSEEDRIAVITTQVCQIILKINELRSSAMKAPSLDNVTAAVYDILKIAKEKQVELTKADIELACQILVDESDGIVRKIGDSSGGLFQLDMQRAIRLICRNHCESLIREQFEGRAIRIMHLLETRHYLDEEQVEKLSMMSAKETRELLYALVEEGYVFTKAVGRTNDFQPSRTFYLYHLDLKRTIRGLTEYTCKLLRNLVLRNQSERKENKSLIDKDATVGPIVEGIRSNEELDEETKLAQIAEVEEMYLPGPDRAKLERFRKSQAIILSAQDRSIRVLLSFKLFLSESSK